MRDGQAVGRVARPVRLHIRNPPQFHLLGRGVHQPEQRPGADDSGRHAGTQRGRRRLHRVPHEGIASTERHRNLQVSL